MWIAVQLHANERLSRRRRAGLDGLPGFKHSFWNLHAWWLLPVPYRH